jgi:hypothetical protein
MPKVKSKKEPAVGLRAMPREKLRRLRIDMKISLLSYDRQFSGFYNPPQSKDKLAKVYVALRLEEYLRADDLDSDVFNNIFGFIKRLSLDFGSVERGELDTYMALTTISEDEDILNMIGDKSPPVHMTMSDNSAIYKVKKHLYIYMEKDALGLSKIMKFRTDIHQPPVSELALETFPNVLEAIKYLNDA